MFALRPNGTLKWQFSQNPPAFILLGPNVGPDGNVYATGWTDGTFAGQPSNAGARDAFLRKYSARGALIWNRQFGTVGNDVAGDASTDGAAVYVGGQTSGAFPGERLVGETDAFVRKYDAGGTLLWTRQFGSTGRAAAVARVLLDGATNVYVAGWTTGALANQLSAGGSDAFVRKYDANGAELWTRQFGTPGHDQAGSMAIDGSGALFVLGQFGRPADTFIRKYAADGSEEWTRRLDTPDGEFVAAMTADVVGNIYVAGRTGGDEGRGFARKYAPDVVVL